jgi:hypothetical protein
VSLLQHQSRFKKYLINPDSLAAEAHELAVFFTKIQTHSSKLNPAEQVLLFVLTYLFQRRGEAWRMSSGRQSETSTQGMTVESLADSFPFLEKFTNTKNLIDITVEYRIKELPQAIFDILHKWGEGACELLLWKHVPTPIEMLKYQAQGKRIVTMDLEKAARGVLIDGHRDSFEFLLHDLLHADLFFKDQENHLQQRDFFAQLQKTIARESLLETADDLFLKDLAYLMSDMNSHRAHLEAHFKAILIQRRLRVEQRASSDPLSPQGLDWVQKVTI